MGSDARGPHDESLPLAADLDVHQAKKNGVSELDQQTLALRAGRERLVQERSGLPRLLWVAEGWTAYQWDKFKASGLTRREFIEREDHEEALPFVLEVAFGATAAVGLAAGMIMMERDDKPTGLGPDLFAAGGASLCALLVTGFFDFIANPNLRYLGEEP